MRAGDPGEQPAEAVDGPPKTSTTRIPAHDAAMLVDPDREQPAARRVRFTTGVHRDASTSQATTWARLQGTL